MEMAAATSGRWGDGTTRRNKVKEKEKENGGRRPSVIGGVRTR